MFLVLELREDLLVAPATAYKVCVDKHQFILVVPMNNKSLSFIFDQDSIVSVSSVLNPLYFQLVKVFDFFVY